MARDIVFCLEAWLLEQIIKACGASRALLPSRKWPREMGIGSFVRVHVRVSVMLALLCVAGVVGVGVACLLAHGKTLDGIWNLLFLGMVIFGGMANMPGWISAARRETNRADRWTLIVVLLCAPLMLIALAVRFWLLWAYAGPMSPLLHGVERATFWLVFFSFAILVLSFRYGVPRRPDHQPPTG